MVKKISGAIERPREQAEARRADRRAKRAAGRDAGRYGVVGPGGAGRRGVASEVFSAAFWFLGRAALLLGCAIAVFIAVLIIQPTALSFLNDYKAEGEVAAPGLERPLTIRRDAANVRYIFADTFHDALYGQGFTLAQDRLLQLEGMRRYAKGTLSEAFGGALLPEDRMARTLGFHRLARRRLESLDDASRAELEVFANGINGFIRARPDDLPLEMRLLDLTPAEWTPADLLAILYLQSWTFSSPMIEAELTAQAIMERFDGDEALAEAFFPFVENPDEPGSGEARDRRRAETERPYEDLELNVAAPIWGQAHGETGRGATSNELQGGYSGSNNWAFTGARMGRKAAVVANDPHLDIRRLPGPWHPVGLFTKDGIRAVGASVGLPGLFVGRSGGIGFGVTVGYADTADLVIETIDPARPGYFREGAGAAARWVEAVRRDEPIVVKTESGFETVPFEVLETPRGPLLPRTGLVGRADKALVLRWAGASAEMAARSSYRMEPMLRAETSLEAVAALEKVAEASLNYVVGDSDGAVAHRLIGFVPRRAQGDGLTPTPARFAEKAWDGFLTGAALPGDLEAKAGWVGTANHNVAPAELGAYSDIVAPAWRYRRMKELFGGTAPLDPDLAALAQRDVLNALAVRLTPLLVEALESDPDRRPETLEAAKLLAAWDRRDDANSPGPLVFQEIIRSLARKLYQPSLGPTLAKKMLTRREFWQERFAHVFPKADGPIFEKAGIDGAVGRSVLIRRATIRAMQILERLHGGDTRLWRWGDAMQATFKSLIPAPEGGEFLSGLLGAQRVEISGSAETIDRAHFAFERPDDRLPFEDVNNVTSLRVVMDLADDEKILALQAGGVTGRTFHPHLDDQIAPWASIRDRRYWWFSEERIRAETVSELRLSLGADQPSFEQTPSK